MLAFATYLLIYRSSDSACENVVYAKKMFVYLKIHHIHKIKMTRAKKEKYVESIHHTRKRHRHNDEDEDDEDDDEDDE